jgi:predicted nucleic acid-binding protein
LNHQTDEGLRQFAIRNHRSMQQQVRQGCSSDALLLIPDHCLLKCASVLLKQVQRQLLSADQCRALLADVLQLPLRLSSALDLAPAALDQAMALSLFGGSVGSWLKR